MNREPTRNAGVTMVTVLRAIVFVGSLVATVVGLLGTNYELVQKRTGAVGDFLAGLPWSGSIETARLRFGSELGPSYLVLVILLTLITYHELRHHQIPNAITYPGMALGVAMNALLTLEFPLSRLVGLAFAFGIYRGVALVSRGKLGLGIPKMGGMIGAFLGFHDFLTCLFIASVAGGAVATVLLRVRAKRPGDVIEYGPFLALGALVVVLTPLSIWSLS
jgi:prepilin signal peptidase PulO-like enzyme (type II secretory pathway)